MIISGLILSGSGSSRPEPSAFGARLSGGQSSWGSAASALPQGRAFCGRWRTSRTERLGLDPGAFSGHSLRAGFLTSAAVRGASLFKMMDVSRHQVGRHPARLCARRGCIPGSRWCGLVVMPNYTGQPGDRSSPETSRRGRRPWLPEWAITGRHHPFREHWRWGRVFRELPVGRAEGPAISAAALVPSAGTHLTN
jgi:hypothetical protein